jgi:hypothetical protein
MRLDVEPEARSLKVTLRDASPRLRQGRTGAALRWGMGKARDPNP